MKERRKKSYYSKVFTGLIMVLLVPILTIASMFWQAKTKVESQVLSMNRNTLNQSLDHMDEVMKSAADTVTAIAFNTQYNSLSRRFISEPKRHAYLAWALQQELSDYVNEKYFDVFVYYPGNDYVISASNSFARLENYYSYYYAGIGDMWEEFYQAANNPVKTPVVYSINGKGEKSYQCVSFRMGNRANESMKYVVTVVLNQKYMNGLLQEMIAYNEGRGEFFILDGDREVIFCTESGMADRAVGIYQDTDEVYRCDIGDTSYMMLSHDSSQMDVYYVYAVSYDYFWSELYDIYIIFLLGLLITIILGTVSVRGQTRRIYRPFEETMVRLQQKSNSRWDSGMHTELEFIEKVFNLELEKNSKLNLAVKQGKERKRDQFISDLFDGKRVSSDSSEDVFAENGITLRSDGFCVVLLKLENGGRIDQKLHSFTITNVFEEIFSKTHRGYVISIAEDRYEILVNTDHHGEKQSVELLVEEGLHFLKDYFDMHFTVGISMEKQGMSCIPEVYKEAAAAMGYRYLLGPGAVIRYSQIKDRQFRWPQKERLQYAFHDFMAEKNCDMKRAVEYADACLKIYHIDQDATLDMVECFVFEVVNNFNRYIYQMGKEGEDWKESIRVLPQSETLTEFKANFASLLMKVYVNLQEHEKENDICVRAKSYIEHHYQNSQLSLAELSRIFGLTSSYFSKMFKEQYQMSIPDYINITRISNAKKLLSDTTESVQSIASAVGFLESSTFIRTFKKLEGITPGVYRDLVEKKIVGGKGE